jgi:hypothetical protein
MSSLAGILSKENPLTLHKGKGEFSMTADLGDWKLLGASRE